MQHSLPLISTLAIAFGMALVFGYLAEKIKVPALVGYLLAGIMASANTPGPVADMELASQLSELGVILLMFGVGLHFSLKDLLRVKNIAVPGAVLQMSIATILGSIFATYVWHWSFGPALMFGLCLSCASTVVLLKALELQGHLQSIDGQIAIGWLVVEDIATVVILVLLPPVAQIISGGGSLDFLQTAWIVCKTLLHVIAFVALMLLVGSRVIPWALMQVARIGSHELFTLAILACAIGIAFGAALLFDVSLALGAFFAGMVLQGSRYARRAAKDSMPLQDAFSVLFFVGVGMMLDWHIMLKEPLAVASMLAIIIFGKGITAFCLVHGLRFPLHTSLTVSASLAQIGEFSFILAAQGIALKMVDASIMSMVVAASILSIALNPFVFKASPVIRKYLLRWFAWARTAEMKTDPYSYLPQETEQRFLSGQVILVGDCSINSLLMEKFIGEKVPFVRIIDNPSLVEQLRERKVAVIAGNPTDPMVLVQAHIITATMIIISGVDNQTVQTIIQMAKELNPNLRVLVRANDSLFSKDLATQIGDNELIFDQNAVSETLLHRVLEHYAAKRAKEEGDDADTGHH